MASKALFYGLVYDENDKMLQTEQVGAESFYIMDDNGFKRYISSEPVDRQVLNQFTSQIAGNEDYLSEQAATMMGKDDIFTKAVLVTQLKNIDQQLNYLFTSGIPEDALGYLGMMGMKIVLDHHGDIIEMRLPSGTAEDNE